ncbi:Uncharacterised protein [Mycobacteroides abscessus subsp. abscessus]|nr:Uncharacterised protein [Mycobacteroides abscessus subsp. abscessus]
MITRGPVASTVATESRRFSPPDRVNGFALASGASRSESIRASVRSAMRASSQPSARGPAVSSSRTVEATNWCSGSWKTVPMRVVRSAECHVVGSAGSTLRPRQPRRAAGRNASAART